MLRAWFGSNARLERRRPEYCANSVAVSYKALVLALHITSQLQPAGRDLVNSIFSNLKETLFENLNSSAWLDESSKILFGTKLALMGIRLWPPPDYLRNDTLRTIYADFPENETAFGYYWMKSRRLLRWMNALPDYDYILALPDNSSPAYLSYDYALNSVGIAIGALSDPLFYAGGTKAMLYGGLGFSMALQIVKAVDKEGLKWLPHFSQTTPSIPQSVVDAFEAKDGCVKDRGFVSAFPEIPALEVAYSAYLKSLRADSPIMIASNLPEDKVFFLTLCYMSCSLPSSEHQASSADCNKAVRGFHAFAAAFSCAEGSGMYPKDTCSVLL
ncbi:endothelin-converting enzyme 2-like [Amblyomma americanum]